MNSTNTLQRILIALLVAAFLFGTVTVLAEDAQPSRASRESGVSSFEKVGSIVTFGRYEQDNDTKNGPEEIEWIVLDVDDNKALLLSKYGLDAKQYNKAYEGVTWETCSLRSWLNDEFLKAAFTEEEQSAILLTDVDNSKSQGYDGWAGWPDDVISGNDTQDKIFLLSVAEAKKYFDISMKNKNNLKARCVPTAYAIANGASINKEWKTADGEIAGRWWLRSPGRHQNRAAHVLGSGALNSTHVSANNKHYGGGVARPALWINLEADIF